MRDLSLARFVVATLAVLSLALNVAAHPGWTDFERGRRVEISGVTVESKYENPHRFVRLQAGQDVWAVELSAVPRMKAQLLLISRAASSINCLASA